MAVHDWVLWAVYIAGWLIACRVLARYVDDVREMGVVMLGFLALWWPFIAAVALFALPVWLVTRGIDR